MCGWGRGEGGRERGRRRRKIGEKDASSLVIYASFIKLLRQANCQGSFHLIVWRIMHAGSMSFRKLVWCYAGVHKIVLGFEDCIANLPAFAAFKRYGALINTSSMAHRSAMTKLSSQLFHRCKTSSRRWTKKRTFNSHIKLCVHWIIISFMCLFHQLMLPFRLTLNDVIKFQNADHTLVGK